MGLNERRKRGGRGEKKVVGECRHELSSGRRIRLSRPLYPAKLSAEAERRTSSLSLTATKIISRKRSGGRKGPRAFVNLAGGGNAG